MPISEEYPIRPLRGYIRSQVIFTQVLPLLQDVNSDTTVCRRVLTDVHAAAPTISSVGGQQGFSCHRRQWAVAVPGEPFSWKSGALPKGQWASWSSVCLLKGLSLSQLAWVDVVWGSEMPLRCPGALLEDADLGLETS